MLEDAERSNRWPEFRDVSSWSHLYVPVADSALLVAEGVEEFAPDLWRVGPEGPEALKEVGRTLARFFRRNYGYDFSAYGGEEDLWLFGCTTADTGPGHRAEDVWQQFSGFAVFHASGDDHWTMEAAWIHPFSRGENAIENAWPHLVNSYGERFWISTPISSTMRHILGRVSHVLPDEQRIVGLDVD